MSGLTLIHGGKVSARCSWCNAAATCHSDDPEDAEFPDACDACCSHDGEYPCSISIEREERELRVEQERLRNQGRADAIMMFGLGALVVGFVGVLASNKTIIRGVANLLEQHYDNALCVCGRCAMAKDIAKSGGP